MTCSRDSFRAVVLPIGLIFLVASALSAQEAPSPGGLLDEARRLVTQGRAVDARTILDKVIRTFPMKPEAEEARKLIDRITSIEILVDLSHEAGTAAEYLPNCLAQAGYGVTRTNGYIPSLRNELADYELVVLWQERTEVKYEDLEYAVLHEYVNQGGHLVFVSNPTAWLGADPGRSAASYPIARFARRFGLKLKTEREELSVGQGKVYHYANSLLLSETRLRSDRPEVRAEAVRLFETFLPYPKLEDTRRNDTRPPEIVCKEGRVTFRYPQTVKKESLWARKALPRMLRFYSDFFKADLANDLTISAIPASSEYFVTGNNFNVSVLQPKDKLLHQLGMLLYQSWMRPADTPLAFPHWMEAYWADMATTDLLTHLGVGQRYQAYERHHRGEFLKADPRKNRIDVTVPPNPGEYPHFGKCEYIYRDIEKRYGRGLARKLREIVFLYHEAGQLPSPLDTAQTVRLVSLAVGKDLFPYFRSLGTHVVPVAVDLGEPDRLRKLLAEREAEAAKAAAEKPETDESLPRPPEP